MPHAIALQGGSCECNAIREGSLRCSIETALNSIFYQLKNQAVLREDGVASWLFPSAANTAPIPLTPHIYAGNTGVALFLAAYHHATKSDEARQLALGAIALLKSKVEKLANDPNVGQRAIAIGGLEGVGGLPYAFARLADWLAAPELVDTAIAAVQLVLPHRIECDERLDIISGCAGTLLALLAFCNEKAVPETARTAAMARALACGRQLLSKRASFRNGPRAWPGVNRPPISGFAHGAAGTACALWQLFQRTGNHEFRDAALEGFAFERSLYDSSQKKWFDPRFNRMQQHAAWCHGAPGIALGRLRCLIDSNSSEVHCDIEEALAIIRQLPEYSMDDVCCGNFTRVEILHTAGRLLNRPELVDDSLALLRKVFTRSTPGFSFMASMQSSPDQTMTSFNPAFFRGASGVGYTLLRLLDPNAFPCILLLGCDY
jgi:lantibiotic modifying enzyme